MGTRDGTPVMSGATQHENRAGTAPRPDLRQRRRASVRREIALRAIELFDAQGFGETTVEQIAAAAGISLRTFYRHCAVKEEVLTPLLTEGVEELVRALAARPSGEPLVDAARTALLAGSSVNGADTRRTARVMLAEPALKARWLAAGRRAQDLLTPVVAERVGAGPGEGVVAAALAGMLVNVATTALEYWALHPDGEPLGVVTQEAFGAVAAFGRPGA
ncbi:putative TetR family transcriptional regulator [Streptomyces sp. Tu6071]|nr:putative TetR family transcriptional regulator [Streptomyces sp. Tu6071]